MVRRRKNVGVEVGGDGAGEAGGSRVDKAEDGAVRARMDEAVARPVLC
jgi:hypothetical protein